MKTAQARRRLVGYAALALLWGLPVRAQVAGGDSPARSSESTPALEVFNGPVAKDITPARYPESELKEGYEGWVYVNFMIDPQGKPYEPVVVASSGNKAFEKAAVSAVERWTFQPAYLEGKPVHAGQNYKLTFAIKQAAGARNSFVRAYKNATRAVAADDRVRADAELAKMRVTNLYEEAYNQIARYNYYHKWGSEAQQLAALRGAIAEEARAHFLSEELFAAALQTLLPLELSAQDFASALRTWERMQTSAMDKAAVAKWQSVIDDVKALRTDERSYRVSGQIETGTSWFFRLYKNRFQLVPRDGRLSEIKLRCDKQYVFFKFDPTMQYNVADKYGDCRMEVVGDPGARFDLIQL